MFIAELSQLETDWKNVALIMVSMFYFYPSMIALVTAKKHVKAIFLTNLLLGWTVVVWLICLHIALAENRE